MECADKLSIFLGSHYCVNGFCPFRVENIADYNHHSLKLLLSLKAVVKARRDDFLRIKPFSRDGGINQKIFETASSSFSF